MGQMGPITDRGTPTIIDPTTVAILCEDTQSGGTGTKGWVVANTRDPCLSWERGRPAHLGRSCALGAVIPAEAGIHRLIQGILNPET